MSSRAEPVGGVLFDRPFKVLLTIAALGGAVMLWRLAAGLGAVTALNDGYPWGLWIAFDVVTGTALACGGYAVALLAYILNKGQYHPLVRPALVTSALGYSMAGLSVVLDIGRPWMAWKVPLFFWKWNVNSILLEVALCIMAYTVVLWIELSPAFLEKWQESGRPRLSRFAQRSLPVMKKALLWFVALGLLLPTMHQSSLGTMMLLAGPRFHPLWNTPWIPLLFLISCLGMGYATVVFESTLSSVYFRRPREGRMLAAIAKVMVGVQLGLAAFRVGDLAFRGQLGQILLLDTPAVFFLLEIGLVVAGALMLVTEAQRNDPGQLFRAAMVMMLAGALYRFDTYLLAFNPGEQWSYFPSIPEMLMTLGIVAFEIAAYVAIVRTFPILRGVPSAGRTV